MGTYIYIYYIGRTRLVKGIRLTFIKKGRSRLIYKHYSKYFRRMTSDLNVVYGGRMVGVIETQIFKEM